MKRKIVFAILLLVSLYAGAAKIVLKKSDQFIIKEMNFDSINIGGKNLTVEDSFKYYQQIRWRGEAGDKFKALLLGHNLYFEFEYVNAKGNDKNAISYIKRPGTIYKSVSDIKECLSDTFYVVSDDLYVKCNNISSGNGYYMFRYKGEEHIIPTIDGNVFYFKMSDYDFEFDDDNAVRLRICRVDIDENGSKTEKNVTSNFVIIKIEIK